MVKGWNRKTCDKCHNGTGLLIVILRCVCFIPGYLIYRWQVRTGCIWRAKQLDIPKQFFPPRTEFVRHPVERSHFNPLSSSLTLDVTQITNSLVNIKSWRKLAGELLTHTEWGTLPGCECVLRGYGNKTTLILYSLWSTFMCSSFSSSWQFHRVARTVVFIL